MASPRRVLSVGAVFLSRLEENKYIKHEAIGASETARFLCTQDMTQYLECKSPMSQLGGIR